MDITPYTQQSITDKGDLRRRQGEIQVDGYAVDEGEYEDDICSVGAPIRDHSGRVIAGITVSMPASRFNRRRRQEMAAMVIDTAERISARYHRPP